MTTALASTATATVPAAAAGLRWLSGVMAPGFVAKRAIVDGLDVAYDEGPNNGPPLVCFPGQSMPRACYVKAAPLLAEKFHVFVVDVRGQGVSEGKPPYNWTRLGQDAVAFLREVVQEPAFLTGNSSGGVIALWAAAHAPELVRGVIAEDAPIFTTEWPRMKDDLWAWQHVFVPCSDAMQKTPRDLAGFFAQFRIPLPRSGKRIVIMNFPRPLAYLLGGAIRRRQARAADKNGPVDISWLPLPLRLFVLGLSTYDWRFTAACVDGSLCDVDQSAMLSAIKCPVTFLHAAAFRDDALGVVGACSDDDVARAKALCPQMVVEKWSKPHITHLAAPKWFADACAACAARGTPS